MEGLCDQLTRGFISLVYIYIYIYIYIYKQCNGMQVLCAPLTMGFISLLYIYISSITVCKVSVLD